MYRSRPLQSTSATETPYTSAHAREAALREVLGLISRSREEARPVFDAILRSAQRLCGADAGALLLGRAEGPHLTLAALQQDNLSKAEIDRFIAATNQPPMRMDPALHVSAQAICSGGVVHIADLAQTPGYLAGESSFRFMVEDQGLRTTLSMPLFDAQGTIGAISLHRREVRLFSEDEIALIQSFAAQAVIAIENVRQFRELQVRLAREAATREILEVISRNPDDVQPVFEVIVHNAARLCETPDVGLHIVNDARTHIRLACISDASLGVFPVGQEFDLGAPYQTSTAIREARVIHNPDIADDPLYRAGDPVRVRLVEVDGVRSRLSVPLLKNGVAFGCINLNRHEVRPFTPDEIVLIETFAAQAVIAIENVRQFRELQESLEQQEATSDILRVISQSREDETQVFDLIVEKAAVLCNADQGSLIIVNEARTDVRLMADWGHARTAYQPGLEFSLDRPLSIVATIRTAKVVHFEDYAQSDAYRDRDPIAVDLVETEGVRTRLNVPLLQNGIAIGCISLSRRVVRPFTLPEIQLVETFAAQAVIAIENVRQFRELQVRLAREAATREILEVISQSRDDDKPVFDVVLRKAAELCHASMASLNIISEDRSHAVMAADWGFDDVSTAFPVGETVWPMDSHSATSTCMREGRVVHLEDMADTELYRSGDPIRTAAVDQEGLRTFLAVPMFSGGRTVACITIYRREVRPFNPDEIALVETFAAQAVIAIENVRQFRELQDRLEREKASAAILEVISQSRDDDGPVFDVILRNAARLCKAPIASLLLVNAGGTHLVMAAMYGETLRAHLTGDSWPMDPLPGPVARSIRAARTQHMHDLAATDEYRSGHPTYVRLVDEDGLRTDLSVPLVRDGVGFGAIVLNRRTVDPFSEGEIALVETFAAQAVIAIENVRQFRELQNRLEREAASAEILAVISQSRDDDRPVFDAILRRAAQLCDAFAAALILAKPGDTHQRMAAQYGVDPATVARYHRAEVSMDPDGSFGAQAIVTGKVVHVDDVLDTEYFRQGVDLYVSVARDSGIRTEMLVPLLSPTGAIGTFVIFRREVRPFTPDQIALVETFAAQAVIAIENVRQFRELQARLEREAATRDILEIISQSRDDNTPVFEVIAKSAARLCHAANCTFWRVENGLVHYCASYGFSRADFEDDVRTPISSSRPLVDNTLIGQAVRTRSVARIEDGTADSYLDHDWVRAHKLRQLIGVPIFVGDDVWGSINLMWPPDQAPRDEDIRLVESFAAQASIAIENVRQFRELQTRLAREAATREILEVISRNPDDDRPVFDIILRNALTLCAGDTSALLMGRKDDPRMTMAAWRDRTSGSSVMDDAMIAQMNATEMLMDPAVHVSAQAIVEARNIHVLDVRQHPSYLAGEPSYRIMGDALDVRSALVVPLIDARGALGTVHVHRREVRPFTPDEIALVETFAAQAVIAIENVRQFKALEALNAELGDRVEAQVGEIERMGRLKRFLPAAVADAVVTSGSERMLSSHRALLGVLFCDIRGFTAFCETAEPEETIEVLQTYHEEMGRLINTHGAGVDHRMGDGIMVLFNDPLPCDDPAGDAVRLAMAMRARMAELCRQWKKMGHRLGFGMGIALGYATVGMVGSGGRFDYTASGTAINLASRLCDEAQDGEILISPRTRMAVEDDFTVESRGEIGFKGIREPVEVFCVTGVVQVQHGDPA
ncbi:MAG: GAF domain-containing protein [Gemmobacter sp.]